MIERYIKRNGEENESTVDGQAELKPEQKKNDAVLENNGLFLDNVVVVRRAEMLVRFCTKKQLNFCTDVNGVKLGMNVYAAY